LKGEIQITGFSSIYQLGRKGAKRRGGATSADLQKRVRNGERS